MSGPSILALDFDGVVCDGLPEYFDSSWRAHAELLGAPVAEAPAGLAERFFKLRPVVEHGWEMPILVQALLTGLHDDEIIAKWPTLAPALLDGREKAAVGDVLDGVRKKLIDADRAAWLGRHRFYPGVVERLQALSTGPTAVVIITTKHGEFVRDLFAGAGLSVPRIFGREAGLSKPDVLRALKVPAGLRVWFVEDRLATLERVSDQPDLDDVRLFLADWGYNFPGEREAARGSGRIALLSLADFARDLSAWP